MKNTTRKAFLLSTLTCMLLTGCSFNTENKQNNTPSSPSEESNGENTPVETTYDKAIKRIKGANYNFGSVFNSSTKKTRRLGRDPSNDNETSGENNNSNYLEVAISDQIQPVKNNYFETREQQLNECSTYAKRVAKQIGNIVKGLDEEYNSYLASCLLHYEEEGEEIFAYYADSQNAVSIHLYYDEDGDEVVEYSNLDLVSRVLDDPNNLIFFDNIIYAPNKSCKVTYAEVRENDIINDVLFLKKTENGSWVGIDSIVPDAYNPLTDRQGVTFYNYINNNFYSYGGSMLCDVDPSAATLDDLQFEDNKEVQSEYGGLSLNDKRMNFDFKTYDGFSKAYVDPSTSDFSYSYPDGREFYSFQYQNNDSAYFVTENGKELHSAFTFDTSINQFVDSVNENTIHSHQATIGVAKGEVDGYNLKEWSLFQWTSFLYWNTDDIAKAKQNIVKFNEYFGLSIKESVDADLIDNLFDIAENSNTYKKEVYEEIFNDDYTAKNLSTNLKADNEHVNEMLKGIKDFLSNEQEEN